MSLVPFHKHLIVKAFINEPPVSTVVLDNWLASVVRKVHMKTLMGPFSTYLYTTGNRGMTGVVVIETSHCSIHIWDEVSPALVQMDLYSCKDFNPDDVIKLLKQFDLVSEEHLVIDRNNKLSVE
jgi:S-adenosylmethionine/arginine decarboxylase-like enzyme